jgi:hypothetical protein
MATETLERRFAAIGARVKVVKAPWRNPWPPSGLLDVASDGRGEYFELRLVGRPGISLSVVDEDRDERCLLLPVREGAEKSKFLCGFDERHWFVAAVPESISGVGSVEAAKIRSSRTSSERRSHACDPRTGSRAGTPRMSDRASGSSCPSGHSRPTSRTSFTTSR